MPTLAPAPCLAPPVDVQAAQAAERNWRANGAALAVHQPAMAAALDACDADVTWALARDGALSARDGSGLWFAGCSVPLLAGRALLRSLVVEPGGHCLLAPAHAGLVVAARERIGPDPVLFVVHPDLACCRVILACADLAADLTAGRLWFAAGEDWPAAFRRAFDAWPGLATPARFVQTRLTPPAVVEPLIAEAQRVIGDLATVRSEALDGRLRSPAPPEVGRTLVVAGGRFRLWTPRGELLSAAVEATPGCSAVTYDTDNPLTAAPLALAQAADGATAVLAVDLTRSAAAPVLPAGARWVTWLTRPAVPSHDGAEPGDQLIVADPAWRDAARRSGWPADRVHVGVCPPLLPTMPTPPTPALGLVADTRLVELPEAVRGYSSRRLLWELIEAEIRDDPTVVDDAAAYVAERAGRLNVDPLEIDVGLFVESLVLPAYAQALARLLIGAALPIRLWGQGWDEMDEFHPFAAGPVPDAATLRSAVAASTALVRPTPGRDWHPAASCARPTLSAAGRTAAAYVAQAAVLLRSAPTTTSPIASQTVTAAVAGILRG